MPEPNNPEVGGVPNISRREERVFRRRAAELTAEFPGLQFAVSEIRNEEDNITARLGTLESLRQAAFEKRVRAIATVEPEEVSSWQSASTAAGLPRSFFPEGVAEKRETGLGRTSTKILLSSLCLMGAVFTIDSVYSKNFEAALGFGVLTVLSYMCVEECINLDDPIQD